MVFEDMESHYSIEDTYTELKHEEDRDPRMNKVMDIIKRLPEKYRNILSLYLFEGYDHEEIGEILSIPSSTSRSNFSRAKSKIINEYETKI